VSGLLGNLEYQSLLEETMVGDDGPFGIRIQVAARKLPDLKLPAIANAAYEASRLVKAEVRGAIKAASEHFVPQTESNRKLVELFPGCIFVEEIPNGYCSDWCCRHLPWFIVTTTIGRFKIGCRKRVISIDWSETVGTGMANELFENEDVTKSDQSIHAWSMDDARRYIEVVIASAQEGDE